MELSFKVLPEWRDCLLQHVSINESAHGALARATQLEERPELLVACQENDALRLLEVAKEYCPLAAPHIMVGMLNVRLGKTKIL